MIKIKKSNHYLLDKIVNIILINSNKNTLSLTL